MRNCFSELFVQDNLTCFGLPEPLFNLRDEAQSLDGVFDRSILTFQVELHWYEAHGIGRQKFKIKRFLE